MSDLIDLVVKCGNCKHVMHVKCDVRVNDKREIVVFQMSLPISIKGYNCPKCGALIKIQAKIQFGAAGAKVVRQPK